MPRVNFPKKNKNYNKKISRFCYTIILFEFSHANFAIFYKSLKYIIPFFSIATFFDLLQVFVNEPCSSTFPTSLLQINISGFCLSGCVLEYVISAVILPAHDVAF